MILIKKISDVIKNIFKKDCMKASCYSNEFISEQRFHMQIKENMKNNKEEFQIIPFEIVPIKSKNIKF